MSHRTEKVESLVQQVVARQLLEYLGNDSARVSVTGVDVSPDIKQATVWLGILAELEDQRQELLDRVLDYKSEIQHELAATITTKFTPKLDFKLDAGGAYAQHIDKLIKGL